jgi:hypothetical protein
MPRTVIAAVGLSAIAIAASGCSGDADAEADSRPATTTAHVETQPPARSPVDISQLRAPFEERFGAVGNETPYAGRCNRCGANG